MPINILMPALSPTMEEGTLARWLVKEGDQVASGTVIAEIETDKATMEFEAIDEGVMGKIVVPEGTEGVKVNDPIAILLEEGESAEDIGDAAAPKEAPKEKPEAKSSEDAKQAEGPKSPGPHGNGATPPASQQSAPQAAPPANGARIFASPLARRLANEKGIDLAQVQGSGPHGRIVKADIDQAQPGQAKPAAAPEAKAPEDKAEAAKAPVTSPQAGADAVKKMFEGRDFEEVKLDGMRRTIAARLSEAKQTIPHFYLRQDVRLDALLRFRSEINKQLEPRSVKLSVNDFVIKALALALQQVPDANAVWAGDRVLKLKRSDVAVAVAIEGGLFTPVIRDADQKSLSALSAEMKDLAKRARDRKLAPHEYQGGSTAVSNLGMYGIRDFDAVINPPHASILAVGAGLKRPVATDDGAIEVATIMSLTLSIDHRTLDGALGAALLDAVKTGLENPMTMLA
jgi:pyruvate dehydrogenase E2 component (dihydrolipoamide acetyltransferase)